MSYDVMIRIVVRQLAILKWLAVMIAVKIVFSVYNRLITFSFYETFIAFLDLLELSNF